MMSDENDIEAQEQLEQLKKHDEHVLKFLDSIDGYMHAVGSLCYILQQGWINIASARQLMGISRVNSASFSLKSHQAATSIKVIREEDGGHVELELLKWSSIGEQVRFKTNSNNSTRGGIISKLRKRDSCTLIPTAEEKNGKNEGEVSADVVKQREIALSMFGRLLSPKLRAAQLSFETALEMVIEMANKRSSINEALDRITKSLT